MSGEALPNSGSNDNGYGQFFDAVEELNFPSINSVDDLTACGLPGSGTPKRSIGKASGGSSYDGSTFLGKFFRALEVVNFGQMEPSQSIATNMSSYNSFSSLYSEVTTKGFQMEDVYETLQRVALPLNESTNSFGSISVDDLGRLAAASDKAAPAPVTSTSSLDSAAGQLLQLANKFLVAMNEFMQNDPIAANEIERISSSMSLASSQDEQDQRPPLQQVFQKFC